MVKLKLFRRGFFLPRWPVAELGRAAFISELITSTVKNDLFRQMLDPEITGRTPAGPPILG